MKILPPFSLILILFWTFPLAAKHYPDSLQNVINLNENPVAVKEAKFLLGEYLVQRNPEKAEQLAKELSMTSGIPGDSAEWARLNYIYAGSHRWQGNYKTALDYYHLNYDYFKRQKDKINIAESGRKIGVIEMYLGNNVLSQKLLLECANIYKEVGTPKQKADINKALASFYLNIDQQQKAKERYLEALEQYVAINDSAGIGTTNANLGVVYTTLGEYDKAEAHLKEMKKVAAVYPTKRELGFFYDFMGVLRRKQGRFQEAYKEHVTALEIREKLSSTYNLCESKINTGNILIRLKRYDEAIRHLNDVLSYEEHESHNQDLRAYELLAEAYEKKNDMGMALKNYKKFKTTADTIYSEKSIQVIAEKDAQYKRKEQDAAIEILSKEKEITQAKLSQSRTILFASLLGLFLFSVASFFIYSLYLKIKNQNELIKNTLKDKNLLLREIHHRVKNNLQIISSLLNLQSRFIEDESALEAIKDGRNRVQSMAILHQNLYREDDITGVDMQIYFTNLINGIFSSYNLKDQIELNLDIDEVSLDVDTVIPIGLITNELITNSLKYAFEDELKKARIDVALKEMESAYELIVKDNGKGIDDKVIEGDPSQSFGQRMIHAFVEKLDAKMKISNKLGTEVTILIPKLLPGA